VIQNVENRVVWSVRSHPRTSAMSPFDTVYMISYSSLIETMHTFGTMFEIKQVICKMSPILAYTTCIWHPRWGDPIGILPPSLVSKN